MKREHWSFPRITNKKREAIIAALQETPCVTKVAKRMRQTVSSGIIRKIAREAGIDLTTDKKERRKAAIAALNETPHIGTVANRLGLKYATIKKIAKKEGMELTAGKAVRISHGKIPEETRKEIIAALQENPHVGQVTKQFRYRFNRKTIRTIAREAGIDLTTDKKERRKAAIAALNETPHIGTVANRLGLKYATIKKIAKKEGMELTAGKAVRISHGKIPEETRKEIIAALQENPHVGQVTKQFRYRFNRNTIGTIAKEAGIDLTKKKCRIPIEQFVAITTALKETPREDQVAKKVGDVTPATVRYVARKQGISLRKNQPQLTP